MGKAASIASLRSTTFAVGVTAMVMVLACLAWTALVPVARCQWWLRQGTEAMMRHGGGAGMARECYLQAASADPLSAVPWRHQFELSMTEENQSNEMFGLAVDQLREVMVRDPVSFWGPRKLGNLWLSRWRTSHNQQDAQQAVTWLRRASVVSDEFGDSGAIGNRVRRNWGTEGRKFSRERGLGPGRDLSETWTCRQVSSGRPAIAVARTCRQFDAMITMENDADG